MKREKQNIDLELLMHKHLTSQASEEEVKIVEGILSSDSAEKLEAEAIMKSWDNSLNSFPTQSFDSKKAFKKFKASIALEEQAPPEPKVLEFNSTDFTKVRRLRKWFAAAAIFVGIAFLTSIIWNSDTSFESNLVAMSIDLKDGSSVQLAPNSLLQVNGERSVALDGNGYFEIVNDPSKPFIIDLNNGQIEVLGTSFVVEEVGQESHVSLESGKLKIKQGKASLDLIPGNKAVISNEGIRKEEVSSPNAYSLSLGFLSFNETPLRQVLADFERHYNTKLAVSDSPDLDYCTLTAPRIESKNALDAAKIISSIYDTDIIEYKDGSIGFKKLTCE